MSLIGSDCQNTRCLPAPHGIAVLALWPSARLVLTDTIVDAGVDNPQPGFAQHPVAAGLLYCCKPVSSILLMSSCLPVRSFSIKLDCLMHLCRSGAAKQSSMCRLPILLRWIVQVPTCISRVWCDPRRTGVACRRPDCVDAPHTGWAPLPCVYCRLACGKWQDGSRITCSHQHTAEVMMLCLQAIHEYWEAGGRLWQV